jgi:hypothetical protein
VVEVQVRVEHRQHRGRRQRAHVVDQRPALRGGHPGVDDQQPLAAHHDTARHVEGGVATDEAPGTDLGPSSWHAA